jgi:hypothetical protein
MRTKDETVCQAGARACADCQQRWVYSKCVEWNEHNTCPGRIARETALRDWNRRAPKRGGGA